MRQFKKLTWLQACFLGDMRVIWCNFLGDSLFQIYVMNFVEIVIDYYSHITSHVSQVFASCTQLLFAKLCTCYCVWSCCGHSRLKISLILMQNVFKVWNLRTNWLKILFLEDLGWTQGFLKNFSSYTHAFCS